MCADEDATNSRLPPTRAFGRGWPRRMFFGSLVAAGLGGAAWVLGRQGGAGPPAPSPASGSRLELDSSRGHTRVDFPEPGIARILITAGPDDGPPFSYAVDRGRPGTSARRAESDTTVALSSDELTISVDRASGELVARTVDGVLLLQEAPAGFRADASGGFRWQLRLTADETCFGFGERAFPLSLRGRKLSLWNTDAGSYPPGTDPLYLSVPFYLGVRRGRSYGMFWDCPARSAVDLDAGGEGRLTFTAEQGPACLYLITGAGPQQVVERFTRLTGPMAPVPLWALGYHQSRWSYRDEASVRGVARRLRELGIPCDALYFDIDYMDGYRVFTWDRTRFPDLGRLLQDLDADGFRSVAILDPGIKIDDASDVYRSGTQAGVFLRRASGEAATGTVWPGDCQFPDFTSPAARAWWSAQVAAFARVGFDGLWNDMNEPATFDAGARTLPDDVRHDWEGEGASHVSGGHSVYGMLMARATQEGLASLRADRRPFVLTRAGYAGVQRYAATWTGDTLATWEHLRLVIPQVCSLGISGIAFSGSDVGGFRGEPGAELFLRWMQLASMMPYFRTHSARTVAERNPWSYAEPTTSRVRTAIERRYRLLPYFYTLAQRAVTDGSPMVRPMFFEDPDDPRLRTLDDQFMLGDHVLVAPILTPGARRRSVQLPAGDWFAHETSLLHPGARAMQVSAGLGLPLFVRAGAVLPMWTLRHSTSEPPDLLILDVYAGSGTSGLYEDEGDGYGFRDGRSRTSTFTARLGRDEFELAWSDEGGYRRPYHAVEVRLRGLRPGQVDVACDGRRVAVREAPDGALSVQVQPFQRLVARR